VGTRGAVLQPLPAVNARAAQNNECSLLSMLNAECQMPNPLGFAASFRILHLALSIEHEH
jgi:hypothetical protein